MNQAEVSGLLCVGLHDTNGGEESYATECPKMSQDSSHETTKFDVVMADPAMYSDHSNANACLDGYQHTGMMAGIQPVEEVRFGSTQHFEGVVADSEEESLSSSPETSSTTNYGYMEQNLQNIYSALDEMVDKEGPVMLNPEFVLCDKTLHHQPHLTFSSDGFKIEYFDWDSCEDDEMIALYWDVSDIICIGCKWSQSVESALITLLVGSSAETRNSGPVRVEFCLSDPHWPRKQQKICHLASRYQEIWNNIPSDDFASENWSIEPSLFFPKQYFSGTDDFEDVIYPKGDPDAVSISSRDVELLLPETFVNDTIIDFYIKYLSTRIETTEKRRYHFFNSFFFRKLADLDKDQGRAPEGRSAFLRVRKWTRKIDIFAKDFLFIPVNFNLHWSLVVICYPGEVDTFEDGETKTSGKVPCILHMDSLKGSHSGLKDIIQSYLWEEWKERHPESASDSSDKFLNLRFVPLELPQQDNSFDCGLFLLHYVELFLMDAPTSFNPLKIDVFSSFLSDDWFVPAEASLKRSLIRKLIHELVTEPSQNYPKLACGNEQLDERHQRSENAEQEATREFLAQGCAAGDPDSVCTIAGTQQQSTSISLNDSEKALPDSGCILETGAVSMFTVQEMRVCPPDNDIVLCLTDAKNEPPLADSDNQLDRTPCAPEGAEAFKGDGCVVKDKDIHEESLHNNQKISNQAEVKVHDIMDSMCCPFSDNAEEEMACQEHSLGRNTNEVDDGCLGASQDMDSVRMLDAGKDDIGPDPESTKREAEDGRCDLPEDINSVAIGDINKDVSEHSLERNIIEAEDGRCDISENTGSVVIGDINKDFADRSFERNIVEAEDTKHEDTHVNKDVSEHPLERNIVEAEDGRCDISEDTGSVVIGDINKDFAERSFERNVVEAEDTKHEDTHVNKDISEHSIERNIVEAEDGRCDISEDTGSVVIGDINKDFAERSFERNVVEAEDTKHEDTHVNKDVSEHSYKRNIVEAEDGRCDVSEDTGSVVIGDINKDFAERSFGKNVAEAEDTKHEEGTSTTADKINDSEQYVTSELKEGNADNGITSGSTVSCESKEGNTNNIMAGDSTNGTDETHADSEDAHNNLVTGEAVPCEDDTTCANAEMPYVDSTSSATNETGSGYKPSDAKRPLHDSTSEDTNILVSDDKCSQKDVQCTEAKQERHYKRRKVLASEADKRRTRSSSMAPSLD